MARAKRHTLIPVFNPVGDWNEHIDFVVDCPWAADDSQRDCRIEDSDECGLEHWLEAAGPEGIRVVGDRAWFPIHGHVVWEMESPTLVLP